MYSFRGRCRGRPRRPPLRRGPPSVRPRGSAAYFVAWTAGAKERVAQGGAQPKLRDDAAPGPLTPASAPPGVPAKSQISRGGLAPGRTGREDARNPGVRTLLQLGQDKVQDAVRHLALGRLLELEARPVGKEQKARVVLAPEPDVAARDVIRDDRLHAFSFHLLDSLGVEVGVFRRKGDPKHACQRFIAGERGDEVGYCLEVKGQAGCFLAPDLARRLPRRAEIADRGGH